MHKLAVIGSRITFKGTDKEGNPVEYSGTVTEISRRKGGSRSVYYKIAEDQKAEIDKVTVVEIRSPQEIEGDIVNSLLGERVTENIKLSKREVDKHTMNNSPFLKQKPSERKTELIGGIPV